MTQFYMPQSYSSTIKQHYHNPRNSGKLSDYTHTAEASNPLCGDETKVYLQIKNGVVANISHETRGCMICVAAASVVSESARGKKLEEIKKLGVQQVSKLLGVQISPARKQCAELFVTTVKKL